MKSLLWCSYEVRDLGFQRVSEACLNKVTSLLCAQFKSLRQRNEIMHQLILSNGYDYNIA